MRERERERERKTERQTNKLYAFDWVIIALTKVAKTKDELFQFVREHSAWAWGFSALWKWQINWNDENRVVSTSEQNLTHRLLGGQILQYSFFKWLAGYNL